MRLLIVIPALNEEASIGAIIERSLAARETIVATSPVTEVEITVVSDGSTDRTVEIASRYMGEVNLIVFEANRGYGAAIKEAWRRSDADLLGFIDADGTCDPNFFARLCDALASAPADVALGCRLVPGTRMPVVRRIGNIFFAALLRLFSARGVRDTASGMRVVRRSALPLLFPLPDGLHFTPAMSAQAILGDAVRVVEVNMPYHERAGTSKLHVGKDGLRFLQVIFRSALLYRPVRPLALGGAMLLLAAALLMISPILHYARHASVMEWMIYRFVVSSLLGTCGVLLGCAAFISGKLVGVALPRPPRRTMEQRVLDAVFSHRWFWAVPLAMTASGVALVIPSLLELVLTGATYEHWSRFIVMGFLLSTATVLGVTRILNYVVWLVAERVAYLKSQEMKASAPSLPLAELV